MFYFAGHQYFDLVFALSMLPQGACLPGSPVRYPEETPNLFSQEKTKTNENVDMQGTAAVKRKSTSTRYVNSPQTNHFKYHLIH